MNALPKLTLSIVMAAASTVALAQESTHAGHGSHGAHAGHAASAPAELIEGEVKKIDQDAEKITLRHGEIKNLNMPAMTMVLRVKDPAMLTQVKVGDKVRFAADRANGAVTIVQLEKAQ
ncbi:copper-binding protein [Massilia sp. YIM B02769]|jgi:Cu/Ag efflux protein CusF|uniref:copper-binding protein n=1 Tax=unclassified Massilia TaxID=2609279 RepID=UPI0025B65F3F|nr:MULTISPECIES: copper-binding protein [unclassified Massilia]MDN4059170.1 copper-binding protein [Massilia sp. YIM B02769]